MKYALLIIMNIAVVVTIAGCEDQLRDEPDLTNVTIDTRFINSDSISTLNTLITANTDTVTSINERFNENTVIIDSLRTRIAEEPDNEEIESWQRQIAKLESTNTDLQETIKPLEEIIVDFTGKRDSLNNGYTYLLSVTNLDLGATENLDTMITTYRLPLDNNRSRVRYRIELSETNREIALEYDLNEEIDLRGITRLTINEFRISDSEFDSVKLINEIYTFYY